MQNIQHQNVNYRAGINQAAWGGGYLFDAPTPIFVTHSFVLPSMSDTLVAATQKSGKLGLRGTNVERTKIEVNFAKSWKWESRFAYCNNLTIVGSKDPSLSIAKIQEKSWK